MTNVVELHSHPKRREPTTPAAERAAAIADLVALSAGIREAVEKTVELAGPSRLQIEQTVQHLVDALHQIENAMNVLAEDGEWEPF